METVVLYTLTNAGHLMSMVELGKKLLSCKPSLSIKILLPILPFKDNSVSPYISSITCAIPSITFHFLPDIPLLLGDPSNYTGRYHIVFEILRNLNPSVLEFLESVSLSSHISAFILDFFCYPALEIQQSHNVPTYFYITSGASFLAFALNFPVFDKLAGNDSFRNLGTTPLAIPGLFTVPASHMIEPMMDRGVAYDEFVKMGASFPKSDGIIINTFELLEPRAVKALKEGTCLPGTPVPPVYCVGPLIADRSEVEGEVEGDGEKQHECLSWLDSHPSRSVVYLCFGSRGLFSEKQMKEIAVGLERSGVRFLWVVRDPPSSDPDMESLFPAGFLDRTKGRGFVVKSWAPQTAILAHEAVGGFVTHCGWNSILEAVNAGVPVVAWPLYAEQMFNKIVLVEEMKIALPMNLLEGGFVSSDEVERRVKQIIDDSEERDAIWKRVLNLKHQAKTATNAQGSSKMLLAIL